MAVALCGPMSWRPAPRTLTREEAFLRPQGSQTDRPWSGDLAVNGTSFGGARSSSSRLRRQPKNHIEENVRRMRRIQKECRQKAQDRDATAPTPVKALWKSEKYVDVPSKLVSELQKPELIPEKMYSSMTLHHSFNERPLPRPRTADYLRAHSRTGIPPETPARPTSAESPQQIQNGRQPAAAAVEKLPLKRSSSCNSLHLLRNSADFIKINGIVARSTPLRRSPSATALDSIARQKEEQHEKWKQTTMGTMPKYLQQLREAKEREERERLRSMPDPDQPDGHRLMPADEQRQTLELLRKSHKELQSKLASLPVRSDTLRLRSAKEEIESRLAEVEEAIKIFSRPKVFVKIE